MKNISRIISSIMLLSMFAFNISNAQVTVSGAISGNGTYTTLSAAFTAINGGVQTGANIQILITANTTEPLGGAILNNGAWNNISIRPSGGAPRVILGAVTAGLPLIDFNGADKVTIDGLNSGNNSLTIANTTVSTTSGTSTIRFQTDATNNVITRCTILGSSKMSVNTNGGNIWFGSNSSLTGNDNNTISYCDIGPAGSNLPTKGIYFSGTTTTSTLNNSGDSIKYCNIYNYFGDTTTSAGIYIGTGSTNAIVLGNKFYQTLTRTQSTGNQHSAIWINSTGDNFLISSNTIGYSSSNETGTYTLTGVASTSFLPVYCSAGTTTLSSIVYNSITNISMSGAQNGLGTSAPFMGIYLAAGLAEILGNNIGIETDTSSISYSSSSSSNSDICGVYVGGSSNISVSYNYVSGITASNSSTGSCVIYCFRGSTGSSNTVTFQNNFAGGSKPNSIFNKSTGSGTKTVGIFADNPTVSVTENTIRNLYAAGGTGITGQASVSGITIVTGSSNHLVSQNTIYNLRNSNASAASVVNGIFFNAGSGTVSRNFVHTLMISGNNSIVYGMQVNGGTSTFQNNMVSLGIDTAGNGVNTGSVMMGLYESGGNNNFYFNSVYIGGNPSSGSANTFAFNSTITGVPRIYRNNIFYNARSNIASNGRNYAVSVGGTTVNPTGLTVNNNIYLADGSGGVFGLYNSVERSNLAAWQSAVGQDVSSFENNPQYIQPAGSYTAVNLHINPSVQTAVEGNGFDVVTITDDYDGQTRSSLTPVDIGADAGNFTKLPVSVTGALTVNGYYATLSDAFTAINQIAQTSANIVIIINSDIAEPSTGAVLNNGTWNSMTIQPSGARTVSANVNAGLPLIDFNGADKVTIDGLNTGGNSLTISNTTASSAAGTSTIRFQTDATNNKITNCTILGSSTTSVSTDGGTIFFGGNSTLTGNDNNVISFCDIGPAGSNLPIKSVCSRGTTSSETLNNSNDTIKNCNIYNFFHSTQSSAGVLFSDGTTGCTIKDNKFYQTSGRTQTSGSQHSPVWIDNISGSSFLVSGNTIGFSSSGGTGTYNFTGAPASRFISISINVNENTTSSIQGNLISGITMSGTSSGITQNAPFKGIFVSSGNVDIGTVTGNTIGSQSDTGSISFATGTTNNIDIVGIYYVGSGINTCRNNLIGGITLSNSGTAAIIYYGIRVSNLGTTIVQNNIIGGGIANSIINKTNTANSRTMGIYVSNSICTVNSNIIRNLATAGGTGLGGNASVIGIKDEVTSLTQTISQNAVYNLSNTNTTNNCNVIGIVLNSSSASNLVSRNFIHTLMVSSNNASVNGIFAEGGMATVQNNMVQLGLDSSGNSFSTGAVINGIKDNGGTNNFYFNSVYIGGSPASGDSNTFAFTSAVTSNTRNYRNNIFYNARSNNGSTGKHYAVNVAGTTPNPAGLTINNNVYLANGSGGTFGLFNGSNVANLSAWQAAVGQDANSYESNPQFINPNGSASSADLHINPSVATIIEANGFDIPSITDDYDGQSRSSLTPVDIGADAGNFSSLNYVIVQGAVSGNGNYSTLAAAFDSINSSSQSSANIILTIVGNTTEPSSGAVLNAGTWSTLKIQPNGVQTITGAVNGGSPLIDLNGADNVTIDGLNTGGNSLTISNTTASSTSGTSTIRFRADATNNSVTNCKVLGSCTMGATSDGGTIYFAESSTTTGNDNNVISNCDIGPAGSNLPSKGIYSSGTTSSATLYNSGDTIRNCNIYDYFHASSTSSGIYLSSGSTSFTIKDNKFYQTSSRTQTTGFQHSAVWINNTSGNNFLVSGNTIGYSSSAGTGVYSLAGVANTILSGILLNVDSTTASSVQGNLITNLSISGSLNGTVLNAPVKGIFVNGGMVNIGTVTGNTIGSLTDTSSILVNSTSSSTVDVTGIQTSGSGNVQSSNNNIGGIKTSSSSTGAFQIYCIRISNSSTSSEIVQNNIIGGVAANSVYNSTNATANKTFGVYADNSFTTITGNTIRNLTSDGGTSAISNASVCGIRVATTPTNHTISQNNIYNLKNTNPTSNSHIVGIYFATSTSSNLISRNFVHNLAASGNNSTITGIIADAGTSTYQNNMIQLGIDTSGSGENTGCPINGLYETGGTNNFYFNSVYIGGSPVSGANNSFAFRSSVTTNTRNYRDNIFYNARSNSGSTGKHYAVNVTGTAPNPAGLTINNNIYFVTGSGGVFGAINGDVANLTAWQAAVGQDANSFETNPQFINPNGSTSTVNLHINPSIATLVEGNGFDIPSVTDDYDGQTRSSLTPVDIGADAGNFVLIPILVNVSGALSGNGNYTTLSAAFAALNSASQTSSNISISIYSDIIESASGAVLNSGSWTSLSIKPTGGGSRTISANVNAGLPLIDLNGADNVTIDGLNTGGNSLTISNTTVSSTSGSSTIRFRTDATNNSITNCTVLGSATMDVSVDGGTIFFAGNSSTTGNDNNVISNCNIGPAGSNLPTKGIFSSGTTSSATLNNSGDTIRNCNIYNYFSETTTSSGVYLSTGSTNFVIKDNKFYQTASRTQTSGAQHSAVWINNTSSGNNFLVSGNTIGYSSSSGTGIYGINGVSGTSLFPISLNVDSTSASGIQGNIISSISLYGDLSGTALAMIRINGGRVNVGNTSGNVIGSQTENGNISFSSYSTSSSDVMAIYSTASKPMDCSNNVIGGITASNNDGGQINLFMLRTSNVSSTLTCSNNTIGGTVSNSIYNTSSHPNSRVNGILNGGPSSNVTGNQIRNLTTSAGNNSLNSSSVIGIAINANTTVHTVSQNRIYNLSNENKFSACNMMGIYFNGGTGLNYIKRNLIHGITAISSGSVIYGIRAQGGSTTFENNMIQLGLDFSGNSLSTDVQIRGIYDINSTNNYYFNSIYVGGSPNYGGSSATYAIYSTTSATRNFRNNIFYNARSNNDASGKHYAIGISSNAGLTINNNIYLANGSGGVFGSFNSNDVANLAAWKTAVGQDANSFESNPQFINPNGSSSSVDLHINPSIATAAEGYGFDIASVTDDYDGQTRSSLTPVDIGADAGNFTQLANQVNVAGAVSGNGFYTTLSAAFGAINASSQTSANIVITINSDVSESVSGAVLNAGAWTSLRIQPSGARTISAAVNAGSPMIDLNGADNVIIDGLNSGGNSLTISNTTVSSASGTSTIRFRTDAKNNSVTNCKVLGSCTMGVATDGGTIYFAGSSTTTGNDNNVISYCDIGPAGSNLPSKGIYSSGTTSSTALYNSGDTVRNCNIYDYFHSFVSTSGIYLSSGSTSFTIKDNKFYQTDIRTQTSGAQNSAIWINNSSGNNFSISGNTIGYSSSAGTGLYSFVGVANSILCAISLTVDSTAASSVQGNLITNLSISGSMNGIGLNASVKGIFVNGGMVNIGTITGNTIGSLTDTSSILVNSTTSSTFDVTGIQTAGSGNVQSSNNNIGGIKTSSSSTGAFQIYCIKISNASSSTEIVQNNIIGGAAANSVYNSTNATANKTFGIYADNSSTTITGNIIRNLTSDGGTGTVSNASVCGIRIATTPASNISQNNIYNLKNTNPTSSSHILGIYFATGSSSNLISRNFVHNFAASGNNSTITGIIADGGTSTYQNNMVQLGIDTSGSGVNTGSTINGINETGGTNNFYFNSVYLGGSPTSGSNNTFAFTSNTTSSNRNFRDNIFYNARSNNGSTGKHYSVKVGGTTNLTINNNIYFVNGSGGVFGSFGLDRLNLAEWQAAVGQDANSFESNPQFINPNGSSSTVDLHINPSVATAVEGKGFDIVSITDDYDGQARSGLTPVDIGADAGNFTQLLGPVNVEGAVSGNGNYMTLSAAFTAINAAVQTSSNIIISINGDINESVSGAVLNEGAWSTVIIQPNGARTISAAVTAGLPLIDLNGADNVTIDGLNSGGNSLTISNTTVSSTSGTSTIRFRTDATNNSVTNSKVLGSCTMGVTTDGGTIYFAGSSTITGNDNNIISNCDIGPAGSNLPSKAIYSNGTTSSATVYNSGDTVRNCNIYDYFQASAASAGIYLFSGSTSFTVKDNKFYQTSSRTQTTGFQNSAIWINNSSGNNFTISGNTIGYSSSAGTGVYSLTGVPNTTFCAISLTVDSTAASSVQGNLIRNLAISGSIAGIGASASFKGIFVDGGMVNIGTVTGNTIGNMNDTGSISYTSSSFNNSDVNGIYLGFNAGAANISNNNIGGITLSSTGSGVVRFYGIVANLSAISGSASIQNNSIGGNGANSIFNKSTGSATRVSGIFTEKVSASISGNIIKNLTSNGGSGSQELSSVVGIVSNSPNCSITQNRVYNLTNTHTIPANYITGIYASNSTTTEIISGNFVHTLIPGGGNTNINGILVNGGMATCQNNMIQLGLDTSGNSISAGASINGINEASGTNNFYFNSVYIGGNPVSGTSNTFAFTSSVVTNNRDFRDNIFYNARSNNGATGKHYAVTVGGNAPNPAGLTINNNVYFANGSGGVFGLFNGGDVANLAAWQTAVGQDANSFESNPQFINPNGSSSTVDLHINPSVATAVEANGFDIVSITDDFDGEKRSGLTPVDIGADAGNFTQLSNQVNVAGAVSGNGNYTTLSSAFSAINASSQTSANIVITINSDVSESAGGAILNAGAWTSLRIQPSGARIVSAAVNAGSPLIDLNGADNVTIDGLNTGGNSLTISNTTFSNTAGTSTMRFQNDATNNAIRNCKILGGATGSVTNTAGNIWFAGNSSSTGNSNNVISNCDIGPSGNSMTKAIFFGGTTLFPNTGDTIRNCNIYDYFNNTNSSSGIYAGAGNTSLIIKDNKFYQTIPQNQSNGNPHSAIWINNLSGGNFQISGNVVGYSSSSGTGTYSVGSLTSVTTSFLSMIELNVSNTVASSVQGNLITNISLTGTPNDGGIPFKGIYVKSGMVNIGTVTGNTIGSMSDTSSISFVSSSGGATDMAGIFAEGSGNVVCSNNNVGGFTVKNTGTPPVIFYCIRGGGTSAKTFTCSNNIIGGTVGNSIYNNTNHIDSRTTGIYIEGPASVVTGNIIRNVTSSSGTNTNHQASVAGIAISSSSVNHTVSQNAIYNLKNTNSSDATIVSGIYLLGSSGTNLISRNFIHNNSISNNNGILYGIQANGGTATYQNNMIQLGLDTSGNSISSGATINGINETGGTNNFYFNSVYIGGNPVSGASNTFAFTSSVTTNNRDFRDNIFYNSRSNNGSTGKHYAVNVAGTAPTPSGLTINNNVYFANGSGGVFGYFNGGDVANLAGWQTAVGQDANSFESNPQFINPNGSSSGVDLHINPSIATAVEGNGIEITTIDDDYDGENRGTLTPVDIGADAGNFTQLSSHVNVAGAVSGNGDYQTLSAAFTAINASAQTSSNIIISINGNVAESTSGAVLNAGEWSTLKIQPSGGARTISAAVTAGSPLIDLNGADNVIIDGLNTGGNYLTISNTTQSSTSGTSTIKLAADATNNTIINCKILGAATGAVSSSAGNIYFAGSSSSIGNSNNLIANCDIGPSGSELTKAIFFSGTVSFPNTGDTIRNCNIYDYFSSTGSSAGIYVSIGSTSIVVKDNKFYQTATRTVPASATHSAIVAASNTVNNFTVSGNTIGYSSSAGTGTYSLIGSSGAKFSAIDMTVGINIASNVQGNTISNIQLSGAFSGSGPVALFRGISILNGTANVGDVTGNMIGSLTDTASIRLDLTTSASADLFGIGNFTSRAMNCNNNSIGGIYCSNSSSGALQVYTIRGSMSGGALFTCQNNIIGGSSENSIQLVSSSSSSKVNGIYCSTPGIISGNTIRNMTNATGTQTNADASVAGIVFSSNTGNHTIAQNTIHSLKNTNDSAAAVVNGIYYSGSTGTNLISRNFIHNNSISNDNGILFGIQANGGTAAYQNNMIQLGLDTSGNSINNGASIVGINETGGTNNFYFNSVYIGGNPVSGTSNTFSFKSSVTTNIRNFRDNIFYNARSNNGSTGKHYAVNVAGTSPNPAGLTTNNNVYFANGSGGVFGLFNGSDVDDLTGWQKAVGQDANSYESNPQFINPNGSASSVDLHINPSIATAVEANGFDIASITDDYDGQKRSGLTPVDIGADAGNFTPLTQNKTLNLTMFIQGFYSSGNNTMVRDTLRVYLRNSASPYAIIDSSKVYLTASGTGAFSFSNASNGVPYYLHLKHRNSIETWSKTTQQFISDALSYSFTTAAAQAYGDNMIQVNSSPLRFGIYSGDVNQDGNVDALDVSLTDNDTFNFASGYVNTDVNGDNVTDAADIAIVDNNAFNFVGKVTP